MPANLFVSKPDKVQSLVLSKLAVAGHDSELIEPGDVIEVSIAAAIDEKDPTTMPIRISSTGAANIPGVGSLQLGGLEPQAAETAVADAAIEREVFRNPNVTITMKQQRKNKVTVSGAVKEPGTYELPRGNSNLYAAIMAAGGLEEHASSDVEIRNPRRGKRSGRSAIASGSASSVNPAGHENGATEIASAASRRAEGSDSMDAVHIDLVSATKKSGGDYLIEDGGVVHIKKNVPDPVSVIGHVKNPKNYEYPISDDIRVTDAIAMAGGTTMSVADKIYVIRKIPNTDESAVIQVSYREAKNNGLANLRLQPGDVVSVESSPATAVWETLTVVRFIFTGALAPAGIF